MNVKKGNFGRFTPWALLQIALLAVLVVPQATSQNNCAIDEGLRDMIESKFGDMTTTPSGQTQTVYVSNVSFIDGITKTGMLSEEAKLIDQAVLDGMQNAATTDSNIVVNDPNHTVPNTEGSVQQLVDIWFDPNLTQDEKYARAVAEIMDPHQVDVLITGMIVDTGSAIQVRPLGVSKPDRTIKLKDLQYNNRDELFVTVQGTTSLSQKAHDEIRKAVSEILGAN